MAPPQALNASIANAPASAPEAKPAPAKAYLPCAWGRFGKDRIAVTTHGGLVYAYATGLPTKTGKATRIAFRAEEALHLAALLTKMARAVQAAAGVA